jgi:hypothetical protein
MLVVESENTTLADVPLDELEDEIATLASHIYAGTCSWLGSTSGLRAASSSCR